MKLKLLSVKTKDLNKKKIVEICKLKNTFWKFNLNNQLKWFKKNISKIDIHNCMYLNNKLIGYTALRKGFYLTKSSKKLDKKKYLLFETLIIDEKYRNSSLGGLLMVFNNLIIDKYKSPSFLVCKLKLEKFYLKFGWKKIEKNNYQTDYKSFNCSAMTYKLNTFKNKKIYFNVC